jgi:uncharacterized membrane protein
VAAIVTGVLAAYIAAHFFVSANLSPRNLLPIAHVAAATSALGFGGFQLVPEIRNRCSLLHRYTGRFCIAAALFTGVSAVFLAVRDAHPDAVALGLCLTATLWIVTTIAGFWSISRRSLVAHRRWMARSYALAASLLTLRVSSKGLEASGIGGLDAAYPAVIRAAWILNLAVAEGAVRYLPLRRRKGSSVLGLRPKTFII